MRVGIFDLEGLCPWAAPVQAFFSHTPPLGETEKQEGAFLRRRNAFS